MRLINVHTYELSTVTLDVDYGATLTYAILSHTWAEEELTLQDFVSDARETKKGFLKVKGCCEQAKKDDIDWVWIDTCCIDKTDSAELSEAINSMYAWYRCSAVCYVYLEDVPPRSPHLDVKRFKTARWFTRGWCLQELIAPPKVEFYAWDWSEVGTKWSLQSIITRVTSIPPQALLNRELDSYSVAQRMSWAADRKTQRAEDEAYCLLGIFNIHMPLIYGEGRKAFLRLQHEILQRIEGYSFLIWSRDSFYARVCEWRWGSLPVLASSPSSFSRGGPATMDGGVCKYEDMRLFYDSRQGFPSLAPVSDVTRHPPQLTSRGLRAQVFACPANEPMPDVTEGTLLLWTEYIHRRSYVCIPICRYQSGGFVTYGRARNSNVVLVDIETPVKFGILEIYLTITHQRDGSIPRWKYKSPEVLEVILVSPENTCLVMAYAASFPASINFLDQRQGEQLDRRQMLSHNFNSVMCDWNSSEGNKWTDWPLSLKVHIAVVGAAEKRTVVVNLWLEPFEPRCHVWIRGDSNTILYDEKNHISWFDNESYEHATDRAEIQILDGAALLRVSIKYLGEPIYQQSDTNTSRFVVRLIVLGQNEV
ncbi:hypothetical protein S7711_03838 [Stachybotrys chartarum IBT 7711]|uniref:Heterokaryon incompatibility domain-containing protein n=1 Tax=Stachybotrys chartarum (strain CBS 109288 / IBT 7711) TaxID=1280523 RepID=A0A084AUC9_STACB|nr:hypothetical protein S7711_03838 [Stachybotrys chartarum IBT 7711]